MLPHRPLCVRVSALALALAAGGCTAGPDVAQVLGAKYQIDDVVFDGNERFGHGELLEYMMVGETWWVPFTDTHWFNEAFLPADRRRLEQLYHAYGYYDVQVAEPRAVYDDDDDEVDIFVTIVEGEPTRVSAVAFEWAGELDVGEVPPDARAARVAEGKAAVEKLAVTRVGEPFELEALNRSVSDMRLALRERGHVNAVVTEHVMVDRVARQARVRYTLEPGLVAYVGALSYAGLDHVPQDLVEREVDFAEGRRYTPSLMSRIEGAVYGMDVFRSVVAIPAKDIGEDRRIDVQIRADESPPQTIKLGFGLAFDPTRWEQRISARYTDRNLFGRLTRLELAAVAGYAELPEPFTLAQHGPVAELAPTLSRKGLLEKNLLWTLAPKGEVGIEEGYQFWAVSNRISVSRFFFGRLDASLSHHIRHVDFFGFGSGCLPDPEGMASQTCVRSAAVGFFDLDDGVDPSTLPDDLGFADPYQISALQLAATLFLTDRVADPRNGLVLELTYDYAGGLMGGDFDFHRITPSARLYWTPHPRLQFAARAQTGQIHPFGDSPAVPIDMRYYLGGAATVRGWGLQRLAPRSDEACNNDVEDGCGGIPIGGLTSALGNVEVRWTAFGPIIVAAFVDAGDVRAGVADYAFDRLYYSTGGGLRVDTPVGLVRVDVGVRLNDPARFGTESRWALHLGLGEAF